MKKLKKQQLINAILRVALWHHIVWCEEKDPKQKAFYEGELDGIFTILMVLDMVDDFWKLREDPNVCADIKTFGISGMNCDYAYTDMTEIE